jgi:SnoaL-like polyketide cyclase
MTPASLVLELVERVWNGGDLEGLPEYYAPTFDHDGGTGSLEELVVWHQEEARTWAGTAYVILDCVGTDEAVALRWRASSTHVGPWGSVPPTGGRVEWTGAHFFRVDNDRIVAMHSVTDRLYEATRLGVDISPPDLPREET